MSNDTGLKVFAGALSVVINGVLVGGMVVAGMFSESEAAEDAPMDFIEVEVMPLPALGKEPEPKQLPRIVQPPEPEIETDVAGFKPKEEQEEIERKKKEKERQIAEEKQRAEDEKKRLLEEESASSRRRRSAIARRRCSARSTGSRTPAPMKTTRTALPRGTSAAPAPTPTPCANAAPM